MHAMRLRITLCFGVAAAALATFAKVPEPDTIVHGTITTTNGVPVQSDGFTKIRVQAIVNGEVLTSAELSSTTNSYVLRIPMDDGVAPRIPGTAKSSDIVKIQVVNETAGVVVEPQEPQMEALEITDERGCVIARDFQVDGNVMGGDPNGNGYPDIWKQQYLTAPEGSGVRPLLLGVNDSAMDNDGDGVSNFGEYVAGTNPLDPGSVLSIVQISVAAEKVSVRFGPVVEDRLYSLLYRDSLSSKDGWKVIDQYRAMKSSDEATWETVSRGEKGFYRLRVELLP